MSDGYESNTTKQVMLQNIQANVRKKSHCSCEKPKLKTMKSESNPPPPSSYEMIQSCEAEFERRLCNFDVLLVRIRLSSDDSRISIRPPLLPLDEDPTCDEGE